MVAYLDHAAGAPVHPAAAAAMAPWTGARFGNPSGSHRVARAARAALDEARDCLASLLGVQPGEVTFVSCGTEADNLAVLGTVASRPGPVVVSAIEHPAVLEAARASGQEVRIAPVGPDGIVDLDGMRRLLDRDVSLVSVQLANHEVGTVQPLSEVTELVHRRAPSAVVHTDAVQAAPWLDLAQAAVGADLISVSSHKLGGPQGVGVLAGPGRGKLRAVMHGGGQEGELRSGTQNVAGAVGMAAAALALSSERDAISERVCSLRDALASRLLAEVVDCVHTAQSAPRLPGHLHVRFPGIESESLLVLLDDQGVCASAGSACASGAMEPSPVLLAMGVSKEDARSALRLTLGPSTTPAETDLAARVVSSAVRQLREA